MNTIPTLSGETAREIPWLSVDQMREVDRAMIEDYEISLVQMMEHAGRHLAHLARVRFLDGDPRGKRVVVLAGTGGNGGGALVAARRLASWGAHVIVSVTGDDGAFSEIPRHQLDIVRHLGIPVVRAGGLPVTMPVLIVDGVIGYSLRGSPRGDAAELIRWANTAIAPTLALDVPSGLDATTGAPSDPCVEAAATMTLALPKQGLRVPAAQPLVGELYLADISVPPSLYDGPGLRVGTPQIFARNDLVRLAPHSVAQR